MNYSSGISTGGPRVLTVDIGGSHIKIMAPGIDERKEDSGPDMTARAVVKVIGRLAAGVNYDVVSIGYPGPVRDNRPAADPVNLGSDWADFDFGEALGKPVRVVNDALLQAIGSYDGGRLLFLGLGTGLGSAMIVDHAAQPLELAHLPYKKGKTFEDYVGKQGMEKRSRKKWRRSVFDVVERLKAALLPDYVVLGGGQLDELKELPAGCRRGDNRLAFVGGERLWRDQALKI